MTLGEKLKINVQRAGIEKCGGLTFHLKKNHRVHSGRKCQRGTVFQDYVTERKTYLNSEVQAERERTRVSSLPVIQWT